MKQYILAAVAALAGVFGASAQIGYQVARRHRPEPMEKLSQNLSFFNSVK